MVYILMCEALPPTLRDKLIYRLIGLSAYCFIGIGGKEASRAKGIYLFAWMMYISYKRTV
jgi:hypothetical protein